MDEIKQVIYRMDEDMRLRGRSDSVRNNYKRYAGWFLRQAGKPMADLTEADIRAYLQTLMGRGLTPGTINMYNAAIRFLFEVTLDRVLHKKQIPRIKEDSPLPDILSKEELRRLFECITPLHKRAMLMTAYGGGLRLSEVCRLRVCDIDSQNMRLFVHCGKGGKDRYTLLSQTNLEVLREYWKSYRPKHPEGWLFLNRDRSSHAQPRALQKAFSAGLERAGIHKNVSFHTLRHCFATHLLESGVDFFAVKRLMGHSDMSTTLRYLKVVKFDDTLKSPLDSLPKKRGRKPKTIGAAHA